jgi:hypothetical protein
MNQGKIVKPFDPAVDYVGLLNDDELKEEDGRKYVFLRGLERLAKERGIANAVAMRLEPFKLDTIQGVMCTYQYTFWDGSVYQGSADATLQNCESKFGQFLTAMAESRAKARALRTAFGITLCSVEEKADGAVVITSESESSPIDDHQATAIKFIAKERGLSESDAVALLGKKSGDISKLTKREGRELIAKLNESVKKSASKEKPLARR